MTRLAASLGSKGAVPPLEVGDLFGERRRALSVRSERFGVERVAGRAEFGLLDVRGFGRRHPCSRVHDPRAARVDSEWTEDRRPGVGCRVDDEAAGEALGRAEALTADLMAERAGYAVSSQAPGVRSVSSHGQVREDLTVSAGRARHRSGHRHMARRAFVLDLRLLRRMIERLSSDRCLPVGVARGVGHHRRAPRRSDRHIFPGRRRQAVVTRHAVVRGLKMRRLPGRRWRGAVALRGAGHVREPERRQPDGNARSDRRP